MTRRALLFDLDGCLVDSTRAITTCINLALDGVGLPVRDPAELVRFIGPPLPESFATLLDESGADARLVADCVTLYRVAYPEVSLRSTEVVPGIEPALAALSAEAVLAVVTSKPREFAVPIVEHLGLAPWFVAVHGPVTDLQGEPKAATLRRALDTIGPGLELGHVVMIGDREHDVAAGIACGVRTVGVTWGAGDRAELEAAGADHVVASPAELVALLGR